uniref:Sco1/2-like protein, putative n=1 Tax=Theileria annulata TaxID=5874 RepID=A0A3B0NCB9_THEAN
MLIGFCNCPDICPEEMDKQTQVVNTLDKQFGPVIQPVFISDKDGNFLEFYGKNTNSQEMAKAISNVIKK